MLAIYKRDLKAYYSGILGFLFDAFLLFIIGIYFSDVNLRGTYPHFGYALSFVTFSFLILVPILTMRCMSEERRSMTDQLLLTSPVSVTGIVLGKYLALVTVFAAPMLVVCLYPVILAGMGTVSYPMAYSAILAFFLVGCVNLAIGMFVSSLTESPALAAVLTFVVLFADYLISGIASFFSTESNSSFMGIALFVLAVAIVLFIMTRSIKLSVIVGGVLELVLAALFVSKSTLFTGAIQKILEALDVTARLDDFINGMFNTSSLIYLLSAVFLFVFFTVQSVEKRRWS